MTAASRSEMGLGFRTVHTKDTVIRMRFQVTIDGGVEADQPEQIVIRHLPKPHPSDVPVKSIPLPFHCSEDINTVPPGCKCLDKPGRIFLASAERRIITFYDGYFQL